MARSNTCRGQSKAGVTPRFCTQLFREIGDESKYNPRVRPAVSSLPLARSTAPDPRAPRAQNTQFKVEVSYFEIYSEQIYDLLAPPAKNAAKHQLKVREHPIMGPYVDGLATFAAESAADIEGYLALGGRHRATAATNMNATSSRSHAVFTLVVTQTTLDDGGEEHSKVSKVNLVDLAGSERSDAAGTSGQRLRVRLCVCVFYAGLLL
jgi:hypothetical protein